MDNRASRFAQHAAAFFLIGILAMATAMASSHARPARESRPATAAPATEYAAVPPPTVEEATALASSLDIGPSGALRVSAAPDDKNANKWLDGAMQSAYDYNCFTGLWGPVTSQAVGYWGNEAVTSPKVGEVYYIRAIVGGVDTSCAGPAASIEFLLPRYTEFAIDKNNKVHCFMGDIGTWDMKEVPARDCPQRTYQGIYGWVFNKANGEPWMIPGKVVIVSVPVVTQKRISGIATDDWLYGAIHAINGMNSPWDNPKQGVFVSDNAPSISYDPEPTTRITNNTAHSRAYVHTNFSPGRAYFDLGTSKSYGLSSNPITLTAEGNSWTVDMDWIGLEPGTSYHWRVRFVMADGKVVEGEDQTFKTRGAAGAGAARIRLSTNRLSFGEQQVGETSDPRVVELTNDGTAPVAIQSIEITGPRASEYEQRNECGARLAGGESCQISVTFTPSATGSRSTRLTIKSDAAGSPHNVSLTGTGRR